MIFSIHSFRNLFFKSKQTKEITSTIEKLSSKNEKLKKELEGLKVLESQLIQTLKE